MLCQPVVEDVDSLPIMFNLESIALFGAMTPPQLSILQPLLKSQHYDEDEVVFRQGELPKNIYIVASGKVQMSIEKNDSVRLVDTFSSGDAFGVGSLIGIQTHAATITVSSTGGADMLILNRDALMALQKDHLDIFSLLMMNVARHLSRRLYKEYSSRDA